MIVAANQLLVNDIAPNHQTMGTLNGIVLALSSGLRAVIPAVSTSIYAIGVKYRIAYGQLFWIIAVVLAAGLIPICKLIPEKCESKAPSNETAENGAEES